MVAHVFEKAWRPVDGGWEKETNIDAALLCSAWNEAHLGVLSVGMVGGHMDKKGAPWRG